MEKNLNLNIDYMTGCTNNDTQHTQAHDDVSLMLATFDTPTYLPNRCR